MKELGGRFRLLRESLSPPPSQSEMARRIGVSIPTYIRYESGERVPPADFLLKILKLDPSIDPAWLLTGQAAGLPHHQQAYLETCIERIEGAKGGERSRQIVMTTYSVGVMVGDVQSPGWKLIGKILEFASSRILEQQTEKRDLVEVASEAARGAVEQILKLAKQEKSGLLNSLPEDLKMPPEKKREPSPEKPKRGKKN